MEIFPSKSTPYTTVPPRGNLKKKTDIKSYSPLFLATPTICGILNKLSFTNILSVFKSKKSKLINKLSRSHKS